MDILVFLQVFIKVSLEDSSVFFWFFYFFFDYIRKSKAFESSPRALWIWSIVTIRGVEHHGNGMDASTPSNEASLSIVKPVSTFPTIEIVEWIVNKLQTQEIHEYYESPCEDTTNIIVKLISLS